MLKKVVGGSIYFSMKNYKLEHITLFSMFQILSLQLIWAFWREKKGECLNFLDKSWQSSFKAKKLSLIKKRKRLGRQHVKFQMLKSFWVKHSITGELSKQARNLMLITYFSHDAYILIPGHSNILLFIRQHFSSEIKTWS